MWDSALDRKQLGESIGSRFAGAVTFYGEPKSSRQGKTKSKRHQYRTPAVLDWDTLHPVERLELLTKHDLARQEKQKLELLRGLLTYYHYATTESRHEVLQAEINKINAAANEQRDRYRSQFAGKGGTAAQTPEAESAPRCRSPSFRHSSLATRTRASLSGASSSGSRACHPSTTIRRLRTTTSRRMTTTTPRPG